MHTCIPMNPISGLLRESVVSRHTMILGSWVCIGRPVTHESMHPLLRGLPVDPACPPPPTAAETSWGTRVRRDKPNARPAPAWIACASAWYARCTGHADISPSHDTIHTAATTVDTAHHIMPCAS